MFVFLNNRLKLLIIPKIYWFCHFIIVSDSYALFFENTNTCRPMRFFLYKKVLEQPLDKKIDAIRAKTKKNIPVVMSRDEVSNVMTFMNGTPQLVTKLLYGSGLRIAEAIRLRVFDIDFSLKGIVVRSGKGNKD